MSDNNIPPIEGWARSWAVLFADTAEQIQKLAQKGVPDTLEFRVFDKEVPPRLMVIAKSMVGTVSTVYNLRHENLEAISAKVVEIYQNFQEEVNQHLSE